MKQLFFLFFFLFFCTGIFGYTWDKVYEVERWGGKVKVIAVSGKASINNKPVSLIREYQNRITMFLSENTKLFMEMPDHSVFLFKGRGLFSLELGTQVSTLIKVNSGRILGIKNRLSPYLFMIEGQKMNFGMKGYSIFEYTALTVEEQIIEDRSGNQTIRPETIADRICVLSGSIDYIATGFGRTEKIENMFEPQCNYIVFESGFYQYIPAASRGVFEKDEIFLLSEQMTQGKVDFSGIDWAKINLPPGTDASGDTQFQEIKKDGQNPISEATVREEKSKMPIEEQEKK